MKRTIFNFKQMEFPISNSQLRNIASEFETYLDGVYINNIVNQIKRKIISVAYLNCQQTPKKRSQRVALGASDNPLISRMYDMVTEKNLAVKVVSLNVDRNTLSNEDKILYGLYTRTEFKSLVPEIISKVQELFPEMEITVDPLVTYILFDWAEKFQRRNSVTIKL